MLQPRPAPTRAGPVGWLAAKLRLSRGDKRYTRHGSVDANVYTYILKNVLPLYQKQIFFGLRLYNQNFTIAKHINIVVFEG